MFPQFMPLPLQPRPKMMTNTISTLQWTITMKRDLTEQKEVRQHASKRPSFLSCRGEGVVEIFQILVFPLCSICSHKFSIIFYSVLMLIPKFPIGYEQHHENFRVPFVPSYRLVVYIGSPQEKPTSIYTYFGSALTLITFFCDGSLKEAHHQKKTNWSVGVLIANKCEPYKSIIFYCRACKVHFVSAYWKLFIGKRVVTSDHLVEGTSHCANFGLC